MQPKKKNDKIFKKRTFIREKKTYLTQVLSGALTQLQPGASKWRLRCIAKLVQHLPFDVAYMQLLGAIMGEVL